MKIEYKVNLLSGIVSIILGIVLIFLIPYHVGEDYSKTYGITSRSLPYAVAFLWIICGAYLVIISTIFKKDYVKTINLKQEIRPLLYVVVLIIYSICFKYSFLVSTLVLGGLTLLIIGCKKKSFYLINAVIVIILYMLFKYVLNININ